MIDRQVARPLVTPTVRYFHFCLTSAHGDDPVNPDLTRAILRYKGAPDQEPTTNNTPGIKLDDADMHPIASQGPGKLGSGPPDVAYVLNIAQPNPPFFDINGISYISPSVPVLLQILSGAGQPQDFLPSEQIFLLPPNKTIEISIPGAGGKHVVGLVYQLLMLVQHTRSTVCRDLVLESI